MSIPTWDCQDNGTWREIVGRHGDRSSKQISKRLIAALKSKSTAVRLEAAVALGRFRSERAAKPLIVTLRDNSPLVRACAATSLIEIGPPSVEPLISTLNDKDPFVAALGAVSLSGIEDPHARQALLDALRAHNTKAILGAYSLFVKLGPTGSEDALIETLAQFPNREMAQKFLNSGNPTLEQAARTWALKYNQELLPSQISGGTTWAHGEQASIETAIPTVRLTGVVRPALPAR